MISLRCCLTALAVLLSLNASADIEFEDTIPLEFAKILLGNSLANEVRIYSDVLDAFPDFDLPGGFSVLGSIDQGFTMRVVLRTELDVDAATSALASAFEAENFVVHNPGFPVELDVGFVTQARPPRQIILATKLNFILLVFSPVQNTAIIE